MSSSSLTVAVVTPAWNARDDVRRLLGALARQTRRPDTTVVVDNASDDGTSEAVGAAFPQAVVLRQAENLGGAGGFNAGMAWATENGFDFAWLLDSDAVAEAGALKELLAVMARCPDAGAVGSAIIEPGGVTIVDAGWRTNIWTGNLRQLGAGEPTSTLAPTAYEVDHVAACSMLVRLNAVRQCGPFAGAYFVFQDDIEFTTRLRRNGFHILTAPGSRVRHPAQSSKAATPFRMYYAHRNMIDYALRYWPPVLRFLVATRKFAGTERLARAFEANGANAHAEACRIAIRDARNGVLGRIDHEWSSAEATPARQGMGIIGPLLSGLVNAFRAKRRQPFSDTSV